ncbi:MAG: LEA type 2 family protein [Steroidobacteraceae bacterium]
MTGTGKTRRCARVAALFIAAQTLLACSYLAPKLETPRLAIVGAEIVKSEMFEQRLKVRMRVQNPNDRALPVKGLVYDMEVAGEQFAHGISAAAFTVPAFGEAEFDMNVTANLAGALFKLIGNRDALNGDAIGYRIAGKVSLASGMLRTIPFHETGTFKLR